MAILAPAAVAKNPDTVTWKPPVNVRVANGIELQDADFSRRNVAVTWEEPASGPPDVGFRASVQAGSAFGPTLFIEDARQSEVDLCGGSELHAVWATKDSPGNWVIEHGARSIDGDGFDVSAVAPGPGVSRFPDVSCAGGRVFATWFQREGSNDRLYVAHAGTNGIFGAPKSLGLDEPRPFRGRSLAVAGVQDTAYVAFTRTDGNLRLKRWSIGGGPGSAVTPLPGRIIGNGNPDNSAEDAVIAAAGNKVAVAWFKCGGIFARVSNDRGRSWGPIRKILEHQACFGDFGASQRSIAIRGHRIVLTYLAFGIKSPGFVGLIRTTSDFADFSDELIAPVAHDEHLVGYVKAGGTVKLAAVYDPGNLIRFRRQL